MSAFMANGNTCIRFWNNSVNEVRPRGIHDAKYHNALSRLLETQAYKVYAKEMKIVNLLTDYQVCQFLQALKLSILLPYVKERVEPAKEFGANHVGHSDLEAAHFWSYVVSTSIELAPEATAIICDGDVGSLANQLEVLYVFIRVQEQCDVFINLKL